MTRIINSTRFNFFVYFNYLLFNDMITKIDTNKIEHQPNTNMCVWDYYNLIESKLNDQLKINKMLKTSSKMKKKTKKDTIKKMKDRFS